MLINEIVSQLTPRLKQIFDKGRHAGIPVMPASASVFLAHAVSRAYGRTVIHVSDSMDSLDKAHRDLRAMFPDEEDNQLYFPANEASYTSGQKNDPDILGFRLNTAKKLMELSNNNEHYLITTCIQALMQKTISPKKLSKLTISLSIGDETEIEDLAEKLIEIDYEFTVKVTQKGHACVRGGLIDLWPPSEIWPIRIELYGTLIESIRQFDPETQISVDRINNIAIMPTGEPPRNISSNKSSLLSFLTKDTIIIWPDFEGVSDYAKMFEESLADVGMLKCIIPFKSMVTSISRNKGIFQLSSEGDCFLKEDNIPLFEPLQCPISNETLHENLKQGLQAVIYFHTEGSLKHFSKANRKISSKRGKCGAEILQGILSEGFMCKAMNLAVIAESDFHGHRKLIDQSYHPYPGKARPARKTGSRIADLSNLEPGDLVVHNEYGVGKYQGLFEINLHSGLQEVLTVEYANNAKLHVPVAHSHLLTRYVGTSKRSARLHRLHGKRWATEKEEAQESIKDLAVALLETQAERNMLKGHAFKTDSSWQSEFEASFPYHETPDQHKVIADVKHDMEASRPMDRLICGDAGYGKTEVAMRAAFKAVMEGKQVAVLVPTTVLALQHHQTFNDRMSTYPIRIEMLSRFCSRASHDKILKELEEGTIDIVIGTHSLLQTGIKFEDLGLVVIDEEQRFGVGHKEHFKQLRRLVDVLTMTATPIPRTLHLSMTGARDISLLQSPPRERMSIRTIVSKNEDKIIREAILQEINRGGQVFFLHNRVMTIERTRKHLKRIVPEANIQIGHGQMPSSQLAAVMKDFAEGNFNVLLSTTIIESGMDIPRANTILIDRADRFGIADLYQLRGRVGRSSRQAYAYLLIPSHGKIEPEARRRITAVKKYSGLSAGFSLAIRDLEIRGAGNLLGSKQSGHITAIGFNLYCQLLKRAVSRLRGEPEIPIVDAEVIFDFISLSANSLDTKTSAAIPYDYIEDEAMRINIYKRFAELCSPKDVKFLKKELTDRFGTPPPSVLRLLFIAEIRILCASIGITNIETRGSKLMMKKGDEYVKVSSRFPQLKSSKPDQILREIKQVISNITS